MVDVSPHDSTFGPSDFAESPDPSNEKHPASFAGADADVRADAHATAVEPTGAGWKPFDQELCELVAGTVPVLFAVCEEVGVGTDVADGWVVAWGIACEDGRAYAVPAVAHRQPMSLASPERALWWFGGWRGARVRLVWLGRAGGATFDRAEAWGAAA